MYDRGFNVILSKADERMLYISIFACLIFAVEFVDILDELTVKQVKRNVFGTYS